MNTQSTKETPAQRHDRKLRKAVKLLAAEIVGNGYEMLGDMVFEEPQWAALQQVADSVGVTLKKHKQAAAEHGPVTKGQVECPSAGDWWDVVAAEGKTWCDGCQEDLPAAAATISSN